MEPSTQQRRPSPNDRETIERVPTAFLDLEVTPMTKTDVVSWLSETDSTRLLLNHNLHSAYLHRIDPEFRSLYSRADRIVIDGMPIMHLARLRSSRKLKTSHRIGSTDWIEVLHEAECPGRLFIYGASSESNEGAVRRLKESLEPQGWAVDGVDGYVDRQIAIDRIHRFGPTLVVVGLGMPLQERFLLEHLEDLPPATYATVGGAIDYVAGTSVLAPRWVGRLGLEWLWRLSLDPVRLGGRYLAEPVHLLSLTVRDKLKAGSR